MLVPVDDIKPRPPPIFKVNTLKTYKQKIIIFQGEKKNTYIEKS